jgi:hypothetical protein
VGHKVRVLVVRLDRTVNIARRANHKFVKEWDPLTGRSWRVSRERRILVHC